MELIFQQGILLTAIAIAASCIAVLLFDDFGSVNCSFLNIDVPRGNVNDSIPTQAICLTLQGSTSLSESSSLDEMHQKLLKVVQNSNLILFVVSTRFVFILTLFTFSATASLLLEWPQKLMKACRRFFSHPKNSSDSCSHTFYPDEAAQVEKPKADTYSFNTMVFLRIFYTLALFGSVWAVAASFIAAGMIVKTASHYQLEISEWPAVGCTCFVSSLMLILLLCLGCADDIVVAKLTSLGSSILRSVGIKSTEPRATNSEKRGNVLG